MSCPVISAVACTLGVITAILPTSMLPVMLFSAVIPADVTLVLAAISSALIALVALILVLLTSLFACTAPPLIRPTALIAALEFNWLAKRS